LKKGDIVTKNLDLNTATDQELSGIQGIGKDYAKKIVEYRNQNGPFESWEDLRHVPGMPGNLLDTLKHHGCTVGGKAA
jgi:competence protein ComEA